MGNLLYETRRGKNIYLGSTPLITLERDTVIGCAWSSPFSVLASGARECTSCKDGSFEGRRQRYKSQDTHSYPPHNVMDNDFRKRHENVDPLLDGGKSIAVQFLSRGTAYGPNSTRVKTMLTTSCSPSCSGSVISVSPSFTATHSTVPTTADSEARRVFWPRRLARPGCTPSKQSMQSIASAPSGPVKREKTALGILWMLGWRIGGKVRVKGRQRHDREREGERAGGVLIYCFPKSCNH